MVCRWLCHTGSARASFCDVYRPGTTGVSLSDRRAASPFFKKAGRALRRLVKLARIATDGMVVKGVPRSWKNPSFTHWSRRSFQFPCAPSG
eukprot:2432608-Prymnesium_polylepis.1